MTGSLERRKGFGFGLLGAFFGAFLIANYADSLRAAGLNGQAPPNGDAFKEFVDTMTDNAIWIIGTVIVARPGRDRLRVRARPQPRAGLRGQGRVRDGRDHPRPGDRRLARRFPAEGPSCAAS